MPASTKGQINEELNYSDAEDYEKSTEDEEDKTTACEVENTDYRELSEFSIL